jgi:site-specific recombinase XerD
MSTQIATQEKAHKLSEYIDYYEVCNRTEGKSPRTVDWYSANLNSFRAYLNKRRLPDSIDTIAPASSEPLSSATIHGHVRTLRAFF